VPLPFGEGNQQLSPKEKLIRAAIRRHKYEDDAQMRLHVAEERNKTIEQGVGAERMLKEQGNSHLWESVVAPSSGVRDPYLKKPGEALPMMLL